MFQEVFDEIKALLERAPARAQSGADQYCAISNVMAISEFLSWLERQHPKIIDGLADELILPVDVRRS
jgi:hypothetical protein